MGDVSTSTFHVLYICRANQCRSPIAELLLTDALTRLGSSVGHWRVTSAGIAADAGVPIHPSAARVLDERGIDASAFVSRALTKDLISSADLILTAERAHRGAVAQRVPSAITRVFTMRQFSRLTSSVSAVSGGDLPTLGRRLIVKATAQRGHHQPVNPADDDIEDPIGRSHRTFRHCLDRIQDTVDGMLRPIEAGQRAISVGLVDR